MRLTYRLSMIILLCACLLPIGAYCSNCASTSTSEVKDNCVIKHWTVCCDGPGTGEVSCFSYDEMVYCSSGPIPKIPDN